MYLKKNIIIKKMVFSHLKKYQFRKNYLFFTKLIFYLVITQTIIKCTIDIYPDHHSEDDPNFKKSQVKK